MAEDPLLISRDGSVTTFRLNRPERLNALDPQMHVLLQDALDAFAADETQRIGVLCGAGGHFCSGSDLKAAAARRAVGEPPPDMPRAGYAGLIQRFDLDKPLIAAVDGAAAGGGFEIALACDLIVATERARFSLPEPHVGFVAIGGGPHRLARQIGLKAAMAMVLTGDAVDANEGRRLGFVNEVTTIGGLDAAVARWAAAILRGAPLAVRASKQLVMRGLDAPTLADAIGDQDGLPALRRWRSSDERAEGGRAFAEKREPRWRP